MESFLKISKTAEEMLPWKTKHEWSVATKAQSLLLKAGLQKTIKNYELRIMDCKQKLRNRNS